MVIRARIGHLTVAASSATVTSPYEGRVLDKERKNQTNNFFSLEEQKERNRAVGSYVAGKQHKRVRETPNKLQQQTRPVSQCQIWIQRATTANYRCSGTIAYNLKNNCIQPPGS